jgi:enoyl-CoA hydratase
MTTNEILMQQEGSILVITINRPDRRNALDSKTANLLRQAILELEHNNELTAGILTGISGHFCAGADLKALTQGDKRPINGIDGPMGPTLEIPPKPMIAAIEGYAVAGGLELALWCDLRVASQSAKLGVFCRRFGVPLVDGGTIRLPQIIGLGRALELILTGREVSADEALTMGLVNKVVPEGQALQSSIELALQISEFPQTCLLNDRLSVYQSFGKELKDALYNEAMLGRKTVLSGETLKGAAAFSKGQGKHGQF